MAGKGNCSDFPCLMDPLLVLEHCQLIPTRSGKMSKEQVLHSCIYHCPVSYRKIFTQPYTHLQIQELKQLRPPV